MDPIIVPLQDRRMERLGRFEAAQQPVAALPLIGAAWQRLAGPGATGSVPPGVLVLAGALPLGAAVASSGAGARSRPAGSTSSPGSSWSWSGRTRG